MSARDRIVAAARRLFGERGFHQTAMADLAEAAQVSVGTIYRSFPGKAEIIRAIIVADTEETLIELEGDLAQVAQSAAAGLEGMILRWLSKRDDALKHEVVAECYRNPQLAELITCICAKFREQFRALSRLLQPDAGHAQIEGASELLMACLFGMGNRDFTAPALDDEETATVVTAMILRALA
jgi:TetR/AcrR family transcriptional repressor of uid operon